MWKWIGRLLLVGIVGLFVFTVYDSHRAGYFSIPELQDGEYPISFKNGLRGIVINPDVSEPHTMDDLVFFRRLAHANPNRKYLGVPSDVPAWFEDAWSYCEKPNEAEADAMLNTLPDNMRKDLLGARLDAICTIDADEKKILRGLLFSVPKL